MTNGTILEDDRVLTTGYDYRPAATPAYTYFNMYPGKYYLRTHSGTDFPHTKPTYEVVRWFSKRENKWYRAKLRLDKPTRLKKEDHPYSMNTYLRTSGTYSYSRYEFGNLESTKYSDTYMDNGNPNLGGAWDNNDDIALIGKLREKIAGSDFNAGVFLREGGETLRLIADSATRIRKALRYIKHGDVVSAAKQLLMNNPSRFASLSRSMKNGTKDMAGVVLEVQYGWRPLLQDVHAAAEFLAKTLNYPMVQTYRVRRKRPFTTPVNGPAGLQWFGNGETRGQLIARLSEVDTAKLVGLTDPASVIWEAVPWSFVADWFIPIGSYLAARGLSNSLTGTFVTTKTQMRKTYTGTVLQPNQGLFGVTILYSQMPSMALYEIIVDRTVSTNLAVPSPNWKPLNKVASWQHCLNAVSLLVQKTF